jgi:hypothetical protein
VEDLDAWRRRFERSRMNWKMFYPRLGPVIAYAPGVPAFPVVDHDANLVWIIADRPELDDEPVEGGGGGVTDGPAGKRSG